jgi:deazaflavin-dependent oxidoreductase (nitroreductase family)
MRQRFTPNPASLQADFFRGLNAVIEPLVRAGFASSPCSPTSLIVLETRGRKTGRQLNVPLLATRIGPVVWVSTFRRQSGWIKNLRANAEIRYWLGGKSHEATATVLTANSTEADFEKVPAFIKNLIQAHRQHVALLGGHVAILMPRG